MADELVLGIDVGTTSVKAGVVDLEGRLCASYSRAYETRRRDNGFIEQDPDDWMRLVDEAIAQFRNEGLTRSIGVAGLCSQVNTHVFVDTHGRPLLPAMLWQDGRASEEAAELDALVSDAQKCDWWGAPMPIDASHALPRMLWLARHHPELWQQTRWVLLPKDYCLYRLTGEISSDPLSNIGLVDGSLAYIPEVLALVPGARERMAPLVSITDSAGRFKSESPLAGVSIVSGTMDAWAGLVGAGGGKPGSSIYLSGTSEILGIVSHEVNPTPGVVVFPECDGIRLHAAPTQSGGDAAAWFAQSMGMTLSEMSDRVAATERSSVTPLFLPQLEGERAPLWDTDLRAAFLGVSRRTSLDDLARAVFEGVALSARHAFETLQLSAPEADRDSLICGGGGFSSGTWAQIRADVFGVPLKILATRESGILGAATLASVGAGHHADIQQAGIALAHCDERFAPAARNRARYDELYGIYKEAVEWHAKTGRRLLQLASVP